LIAYLALLLILLASSGCITRKQIEAATWLNNFHSIDPTLCYPNGPLYERGFFRRLDDGRFQFISICTETASKMLSATPEDYKKLIDAALGSKKRE
jgi:hypothetical protein